MAVTLNALTTGVGGLQTTGDTSGQISLQSDGSTVLAVTASGVSITGTLSSTTALPATSGGTGLTSAGSNGNVLTSNGTTWTSAALPAPPTGITATTGLAPYYGARAWVNFNGTGAPAIRASGNVTSITDNGTGDYTVNFTTAMPDVNYCSLGSTIGTNSAGDGISVTGFGSGTIKATTFIKVLTSYGPNNTQVDTNQTNVAVFR